MRQFRFLVLLLVIGCQNSHELKDQRTNTDTSSTVVLDTIQPLNQPTMELTDYQVYSFENDTLSQRIEVSFVTESEIKFRLVCENKKRIQSSQIEGKAKCKIDADPEIDEDEDGNAYPAQQYFFENYCWLSIRIDLEQKEKIGILRKK